MRQSPSESSQELLLNVPLNQFFEFRRSPFPQVLPVKDLYFLPQTKAIAEMTEFAFENGLCYAVIGAVGCGKSR